MPLSRRLDDPPSRELVRRSRRQRSARSRRFLGRGLIRPAGRFGECGRRVVRASQAALYLPAGRHCRSHEPPQRLRGSGGPGRLLPVVRGRQVRVQRGPRRRCLRRLDLADLGHGRVQALRRGLDARLGRPAGLGPRDGARHRDAPLLGTLRKRLRLALGRDEQRLRVDRRDLRPDRAPYDRIPQGPRRLDSA